MLPGQLIASNSTAMIFSSKVYGYFSTAEKLFVNNINEKQNNESKCRHKKSTIMDQAIHLFFYLLD